MSLTLSKTNVELRDAFLALKTADDVANLLEVPPRTLRFFLRRTDNYSTFDIAKKSGKPRQISAPVTGLKIIQRKLNLVLHAIYKRKAAVHGFALDRSILSNALEHVGKRYVLNVDLADFFPTINFGRVRGLFMSVPYKRNPAVATTLARICCFEGALPQGAPTSPAVSNMICAKMDSQLTKLASKYRISYTRYADDISFSSSRRVFPRGLAYHEAEETGAQLKVGSELESIVVANGFKINPDKVRLHHRDRRQQVTGLTVNVRPNVNRQLVHQVRAMLHSWRTRGLAEAEQIFRASGDKKHRNSTEAIFSKVVKGKIDFIGFVKGRDSTDHARLLWTYYGLDKAFPRKPIQASSRAGRLVVSEAVWVLESERGEYLQGSAFFLKGYGLVTCSHVLEDGTRAYHPARPSAKFDVTLVARDETLDLAILKISAVPLAELAVAEPVRVVQGDYVALLGFPHFRLGQSVSREEGTVTGSIFFGGVQDHLISPLIVQGSSGGPVLDSRNRVIGIAVKGSPNNAEGAGHVMSIARSIDHLKTLRSNVSS